MRPTTEPPKVGPARNWEILAAWLDAEWLATSASANPIQRGMYEGYAGVAEIMKDGPPDEREDRLYHFLLEALTSAGTPEEIRG